MMRAVHMPRRGRAAIVSNAFTRRRAREGGDDLERVTQGGAVVLMIIGGFAFDDGQTELGVVLALVAAVAAIAVVTLLVIRGMRQP